MKKHLIHLIAITLICLTYSSNAANVLSSSWSNVARGKCSDQSSAWWGSAEAIRIAENVLLYQRSIGGWQKNTDMHLVLTEVEKNALIALKPGNKDCTIDNGAVSYELTYLSRVYGAISDATVKTNIETGFLKGINYLIKAQYDNGGWPQYYPLKGNYYDMITFNDDAMIHVMEILRHVYNKDNTFSIKVDDSTAAKAKAAFDKGLDCILKTQYVQQGGLLTTWCAQHHYQTLLPALARAYELPSLSGAEPANIIKLLMSIDNPSDDIIRAVYAASEWFNNNRIIGQRLEGFTNSDGVSDKRIVNDPSAADMWARFYTLENSTPFFCDRDGVKVYTIAEIGHERRNGYAWYGNWGASVISSYNNWIKKWSNTVLTAPINSTAFVINETVKVNGYAKKYSSKNLLKFELIVDTNTVYTYTTQSIDTTLTGFGYGDHSIVIKSIYEDNTFDTDSSIITITRPSHTLTMFYGTGAGTFPEGTVITIKADKRSGKVFDKWLGDIDFIGSITDSVTTFTIPNRNTKVRASFKTAPPSTGVEQAIVTSPIIYPNPVIDNLSIDLTDMGVATIEIYNIIGNKVVTEINRRGIITLKLDFLPTGIYFVNILKDKKSAYSTKIIKY